MRINFNSFGLFLSGGNRTVLEVANRLTERGHKVTITTLGSPRDSRWFSPIKSGIRHTRMGAVVRALRIFEVATTGRLSWTLYENMLIRLMPDCDVNVATFCFTAYPTYCSRIGKPFYLIQDFEPRMFRQSALRERARLSYSLPMQRLVVSRWLRDEISRMTGEEPTYVGNGVNTRVFRPRATIATRRSDHFRVMGFFRGIQWKGETELLHSLKRLSRRLPVKLVAVGNKRIGGLHFPVENHGVVANERLAAIYSSADVFVFPSQIEGFGLPPLEAMACGTPVVVTDCSGVNEYARNEYNALVANREDLARSIERIWRDEELVTRLRQGGFETAREYDLEKMVDRVVKAFSEHMTSASDPSAATTL